LEPWGNAELSTIDTALFVGSAHYATQCLQPHAGATATALVRKFLTNLSWGHALPATCDSNVMKLKVGVAGSDTQPWSEYHILAYVATRLTQGTHAPRPLMLSRMRCTHSCSHSTRIYESDDAQNQCTRAASGAALNAVHLCSHSARTMR
jgi:hypothetical protein